MGMRLRQRTEALLRAWGTEAGMHEMLLTTAYDDWGFRPEDVAFGPVRIWQSNVNPSVTTPPVAAMRAMVERLPHATLNEYDGANGGLI